MLRSIRFRLTLWYTVIVVLTFVCIAWAVEEYVRGTLSDALDRSVTKEIQWVDARFSKFHERGEAWQVMKDDVLDHIAYNPVKEYVEIWDSTGKIFYQSSNLVGDTLRHHVPSPDDGVWSLQTLKNVRNIELRLAHQRTSRGLVFVAMPTESIHTPVDHLLRVFAFIGPIVIIVSVGSGMYLARKSLSKVNQVIDAAQRITADRLHERLPEHTVQDEIGKLVSTLNEMIARLDRSFHDIKQFTADASHELRTPLSVIRTQLESALESKVGRRELKMIIADCLDETIHMTAIIENLLLLTKADRGQEMVMKERVDLQELVRQLHEDSVILASHKSIMVVLSRLDPVTVVGDERRLRQMLLNLVDNAIKYTQKRGKISLRLEALNSLAHISVVDNGIGIPANEIPQIFNRFYRVDKARTRETGGVGLGLSIAKLIAEAHGGTISVVSELNKGSAFSITLPIETSE
ncbi:MAG: HAMP domain-containing sensor histidine kinase [Bacteroidota bacterium]|jgi:signal transduction histidine kinase